MDGRYRLGSVLGRGAQGTTFRATAPSGAAVALKEIPVGRAADDKQRARLAREAAVLGELRHPGIPRLHETFFAGEGRARSLYVVQDLVEGEDLERWIEGHRTSEAEVVAIVRSLCEVLGWLHLRSPPVVHRDLKPANVIRQPDGRLVLVDFGSVRAALRDPVAGGSTVAGTFGYMAPEQLVGDASPRSDLYALGALAVRLLTRKDPAGLLDRAGRMDWRAHATVSPGFGAVLDALLQPEPEDRPADAAEVVARLDAPPPAAAPLVRAKPAPPVPAADAPALAERVGTLLSESLGSPGRVVPAGGGWRWVSLHGRVEADLVAEPGGLAVRPRIATNSLVWGVVAATIAGMFALSLPGWAFIAGALVAKKAIALALVGLMMSGAILAGPLTGWITRRRMVAGALRAAGPGVRAMGPVGAGDLVRVLEGPLDRDRAEVLAQRFEAALGRAGDLSRLGDGWRWRSTEGARVELLLHPDRGATRLEVRASNADLAGAFFGGVGGGAGGGMAGGLSFLFFSMSMLAGALWVVGSFAAAFGLATWLFRVAATSRATKLARALRRLE